MFHLSYKYFSSVMFVFVFLSISLVAESGQVSLSSKISQKEILKQPTGCIKPTKADNALLIEDISKMHPDLKKSELSSMHLRRLVEASHRFSLLAPSAWKPNGNLAEDTILYLTQNNNNAFAEYLVREIPLDAKYRKIDPGVLLQAVSDTIKEASGETGASPLKSPVIYTLPDIKISYFELTRSVNGVKLWELHTVIYDGKHLYDVAVMTDQNSLETGHFLSELAAYSFWTRESCS